MRSRLKAVLPLIIILCIALVIRVYLLVHTNGVIDGDEALVGIQAQRILQGERPVYFYGTVYMGSIEAYLSAIIFSLIGPSVWTLRGEAIFFSLVLVSVTWCFAGDLSRELSRDPRQFFQWSVTLLAALLPMYDIAIEMRTWGAWIEVYIVMLLLLMSAFYLVRRWKNATKQELLARWAGVGFLIGLGFWLYPLVVVAVVAMALWIAGGLFLMVRQGGEFAVLRRLPLALVALPAAAIGGFPAIVWGAQNQWANVAFIFQQVPVHSSVYERVRTVKLVSQLYAHCVAPRIIGGSMTLETGATQMIHTITLWFGIAILVNSVVILVGSFFIPSLQKVRQLLALPLLFGFLSIAIFLASSSATNGLGFGCQADFVGRYASPLLLVMPFFLAATVVTILLIKCSVVVRGGAVFILVGYVVLQVISYPMADPSLTFQSPYCLDAIANNDAVIAYMQKKHITRAWANNFVGNPITFKTQARIIVVDPTGFIAHQSWLDRIPAYTQAVAHAERASVLKLVAANDQYPQFLRQLDTVHITYRVARFASEPGVDLLVVTPLNRSIPITTDREYTTMFVCQK